MAETEAIWEPTEYRSVCPHCSATNLSKIPVTHYVLIATKNIWLHSPHRRRLIYAISQRSSQFQNEHEILRITGTNK
jgi:hypothetical protein